MEYKNCRVEIIYFDNEDVIATSATICGSVILAPIEDEGEL